jgi:hypothetical protein
MPDYSGKDLYVQWITSAGTAVLSSDFRQGSYKPSVNLIDKTAGADAAKTYFVDRKDGTYSLQFLDQTGGTVITNALVEGTEGTLIWGPEGTVAGKPKRTMPAISLGAQCNYPYNDLVEISVDFQQNGARVENVY